ncbi:MAG: HTTM domain-containing protein [Planctomycetaceae bacterium]
MRVEPTPPTVIQRLFAPIDIGLIVVFRVAFGGCMLIEVCRYFAKGWIDIQFVRPAYHFKYYGCEWVQVPPGHGMHVIFALLGTCAVMMAIGFLYRIAAIGFAVLFTWIFLIDQTWYLNHFYLITLLGWVSTILPANRAWSVDAWLRPALRSRKVPAWSLYLLRFMIALPYFFGGIAKINPDWLTGVPMRLMMGDGARYPILGQHFDVDSVVLFFAWAGMLFDLLIVPALLWAPTRIPAYISAVAFHASNARMFKIGIFPLVMVAASMLFFPPEWLATASNADTEQPAQPPPAHFRDLSLRNRLLLVVLGLFVTWQILMPFRHWLYPGDVSWNEEGHRFSWHMKLRTKTATAAFRATDPDGHVLDTFTRPEQILHPRQRELLGERPDFVLQLPPGSGSPRNSNNRKHRKHTSMRTCVPRSTARPCRPDRSQRRYGGAYPHTPPQRLGRAAPRTALPLAQLRERRAARAAPAAAVTAVIEQLAHRVSSDHPRANFARYPTSDLRLPTSLF